MKCKFSLRCSKTYSFDGDQPISFIPCHLPCECCFYREHDSLLGTCRHCLEYSQRVWMSLVDDNTHCGWELDYASHSCFPKDFIRRAVEFVRSRHFSPSIHTVQVYSQGLASSSQDENFYWELQGSWQMRVLCPRFKPTWILWRQQVDFILYESWLLPYKLLSHHYKLSHSMQHNRI